MAKFHFDIKTLKYFDKLFLASTKLSEIDPIKMSRISIGP